jgi:hypothetical protein
MSRFRFILTASTDDGKMSSQMVDCRCRQLAQGLRELTLVLTIWSLRGELLGCVSGAPTSATNDVQNSISTTPVAPWSSGVS